MAKPATESAKAEKKASLIPRCLPLLRAWRLLGDQNNLFATKKAQTLVVVSKNERRPLSGFESEEDETWKADFYHHSLFH